MNTHISRYLDKYVESDNVSFAVLLKGSWGVGKSYFINSKIKDWEKAKVKFGEYIELSPIYVSLNGLTKTNDINKKINRKLYPLLNSKGVLIGKKILSGLAKTTFKIDLDFDNDESKDGSIDVSLDLISLLENDNSKVKGHKILIFDDIERCKIPIDELFGYLNNFIEHSKCKVILIADEEKINLKEKENTDGFKYKDIKEKIVGKEFEIQQDIKAVLTEIVNSFNDKKIQLIFKQNQSYICELIEKIDKKNLRIITQGLLELEMFLKGIESNYLDNEDLMKNIVIYFLMTFIQVKEGAEEFKYFNGFSFFLGTKSHDLFNEDKFEHYIELIQKFQLTIPDQVIPIKYIYEYIEKGIFLQVNNIISRSVFYNTSAEKYWEKLYRWYELNDKEFDESFEQTKLAIEKEGISEIGELLQHFSLLLEMDFIGLKLNISSLKQNVCNNVDNILEVRTKAFNNPDFLRKSYNKEYRSSHNKDFNEIISIIKDKIQSHNKKVIETLTVKAFDKIYNIDTLEFDIEKISDSEHQIFLNDAIKKVDAKVFFDKIITLSTKDLHSLKFVIRKFKTQFLLMTGLKEMLIEFTTTKKDSEFIVKLFHIKQIIAELETETTP